MDFFRLLGMSISALPTAVRSSLLYCIAIVNAQFTYTGHLSVGSRADSAYEYFLKQWLLTGRSETKARDQCTIIVTSLLYD